MAKRQHTTPMLVSGGEAVRLRRVGFSERTFDEGWLQELLFRFSQLVPVDEIEPAFGPLIPLAREVPTRRSGALDLLYVSPDGYPTLVETKLWRNPEARRRVVAQIIDYAKEFATWSYEDLAKAVKGGQAAQQDEDPVWAAVQDEEDVDRREFTDTLNRNLSSGRFLLLIVGDGIREGMERMAAYLQRTPSLQFTLALVEMATYRLDAKEGERLLVQPRVVARTQEVIRAVVRIEREAPSGAEIAVAVPSDADDGGGGRTTITEEEFYRKLSTSQHGGPEVSAFARSLLADVEELGVTVDWKTSGPALKFISGSGKPFSLGAMNWRGGIELGWLVRQCQKAGIPGEIGARYLEAISGWIPGSHVTEDGWGLRNPKRWGRTNHIRDLMAHREEWLQLITETVRRIREALDEVE